MSKLYELFVDNINKAITAADVMNDTNTKPMAYASIAQAIAIYLNGEKTIATNEDISTAVESIPAINNEIDVHEEALRLSEKNKEVIKAIDEAIASKPSWELPYDENGIPYLNDEDFADPQKVLAYENAMTPEIQAKKREIEIAQGNAVLNETTESAPAPVAPAPVAPTPTVPTAQEPEQNNFSQEDLNELENYKSVFDYANNPNQLDNLYHNFTDGVYSTLADITPATLNAFLIFIKEELAKAFEAIEGWKASWITKEGLDALISQAYGVEGATIEEYLHEGNVFWFLEYVELYNANAYFNSYVNGEIDINTLNNYVKQYFEDNTLTIDCITDENVVGFVHFIQSLAVQTA